MEPLVAQPVTVAGTLQVPVDHPTLKRALERYACPVTGLCISPAEPVYVVMTRGREKIIRAVGLNGHRVQPKSKEGMRRAVAKILGVNVEKLYDECAKLKPSWQHNRVRQAV